MGLGISNIRDCSSEHLTIWTNMELHTKMPFTIAKIEDTYKQKRATYSIAIKKIPKGKWN
jgi:hypothetical protein